MGLFWKVVWACLGLAMVGFPGAGAASNKAGLSAMERGLLDQMAKEGTNTMRLYALADLCHDAGAGGDKEAVVRAEGYLRQLLSSEPDNAQGLGLLGSVYTMKGRDSFWPTTQLKLVREGIEMMDKAVKLAPEDLRTRMTRVFNNAHMPDFLGRGETVIADLEWLWGKVEKEPQLFTVRQRQELALHWGKRLKRLDRVSEARKVLEAGRDFEAQSPMARQIAAELAKIR